MARVLEQFGRDGRMWHRNDDYPNELVTPRMIEAGWVEPPPVPVVEQATAAPGTKRASTRTAKKTTAVKKQAKK